MYITVSNAVFRIYVRNDFFLLCFHFAYIYWPVVSAALRFYTAQTIVTVTTPDGQTQQKMTPPLHSVTNPEEKRKIIGDTFMKVQ